jgi:hypothetical protein
MFWNLSTSSSQFFAAVYLKIQFVRATTRDKGVNGCQRFEAVRWLHHVSIESHSKTKTVRSHRWDLTTQWRSGVSQKNGIVNRSFASFLRLFTFFEVKYFRLITLTAMMLSSSYCVHSQQRLALVSKIRNGWLSFGYSLLKSCLYTTLRGDRNASNTIVLSYRERDRWLKRCHSLREVPCLSKKPHILRESLLALCPSVGAI